VESGRISGKIEASNPRKPDWLSNIFCLVLIERTFEVIVLLKTLINGISLKEIFRLPITN